MFLSDNTYFICYFLYITFYRMTCVVKLFLVNKIKYVPVTLIYYIYIERERLIIFVFLTLNVTHLHKTSHKSPNIKWQKIAFYLKMSKMCYFFIQTTFFWARLFQNICFLHLSARYFC